jgi:inhibitor of KinA sporulation pathway (predicted exonuclease)
MKELLVSLDLELNQPSRRIIQIGAVVGNIRTGEIVSQFDSKVSPDEELSPAIAKLTKIKQEEVNEAPKLREAYESLKRWLDPFASERVLNPITWGGGDTRPSGNSCSLIASDGCSVIAGSTQRLCLSLGVWLKDANCRAGWVDR